MSRRKSTWVGRSLTTSRCTPRQMTLLSLPSTLTLISVDRKRPAFSCFSSDVELDVDRLRRPRRRRRSRRGRIPRDGAAGGPLADPCARHGFENRCLSHVASPDVHRRPPSKGARPERPHIRSRPAREARIVGPRPLVTFGPSANPMREQGRGHARPARRAVRHLPGRHVPAVGRLRDRQAAARRRLHGRGAGGADLLRAAGVELGRPGDGEGDRAAGDRGLRGLRLRRRAVGVVRRHDRQGLSGDAGRRSGPGRRGPRRWRRGPSRSPPSSPTCSR